MKTLVQITAQTYENKAFYEGGTSWKKSGTILFHLYVDGDDLWYAEKKCIEAIKKMLEQKSNSVEKFEYVSHEIIYIKPIQLDSKVFTKILSKIYKTNIFK